jgi:DNA recombination protein RmuC
MEIVFLVVGLAVGAAAVWAVFRARLAALRATLEHERRAAAEREAARADLETTLKALSADLQREARDDLESRQRAVERMIAPLKESLENVTSGVRDLEKARSESQGALSEQIRGLVEAQARLQAETASLVGAMRATGARGRWGELQLRRVVELAGMVEYCDFDVQRTLAQDGRTLRPDLVVRLPGGRNIVVDAKAPFDPFVEAANAPSDEAARAAMAEHARKLREHVSALAARAYWEPFEPTPGFVVLFVPAEPLFHAALEHDPGLIEAAARQGVVLASPASLIALLRSVAEGWREERVAESAREVSLLGKQLYERLATLAGHFVKLRRGLDTAVGSFNDAVGSLERSVLPSARRFPQLGVPVKNEIPQLEPVDRAARTLQAPELLSETRSPQDERQSLLGPADPAEGDVRDAA